MAGFSSCSCSMRGTGLSGMGGFWYPAVRGIRQGHASRIAACLHSLEVSKVRPNDQKKTPRNPQGAPGALPKDVWEKRRNVCAILLSRRRSPGAIKTGISHYAGQIPITNGTTARLVMARGGGRSGRLPDHPAPLAGTNFPPQTFQSEVVAHFLGFGFSVSLSLDTPTSIPTAISDFSALSFTSLPTIFLPPSAFMEAS